MEIKDLLKLGIEQRASDLHLLPDMPPLLRIDGDLTPLTNFPPLNPQSAKKLIYSIMNDQQRETFEKNKVMDMSILVENIGIFRVSVLHQMHGVAAVFRIISEHVPTFEELHLPAIFKRLLTLSHGLILICGPTGAGKSTTLASMADYINLTRATHIITIEDPIEYVLTPKKSAVNQLQVGRDTPDIATALRGSLRQDPDVILLGEMRDLETIRLALTAAETGHLVLASLHSSSAPLAVSRIVDIFPAAEKSRVRNLLSETTQAIICQRLVKKIGGGRIAAFEIMLANAAIRHLIRQDMIAHMESTIQTSGDIGMCTFDQYLQELVAKKLITTAVARSLDADLSLIK